MVDRYRPVSDCVVATVSAYNAAHPDGEYVRYADYEAVRDRLEAAESLLFEVIENRTVLKVGEIQDFLGSDSALTPEGKQ